VTAPVRIEACAWGDLRFATLARLCGFADAEHALIKVSKIWSWQTEHYTPDAPTYVVDAEIIESALGELGAERMVRARLAEATPDGFRIKGSEDRIEWLWKSRNASRKGGEATKRKHANKGGPDGLAPAGPEAMPDAGPQTGLTPGPLSPDLSPDQQNQKTHTRVRERHPAVGGIARRVWDYGAKVRPELTASQVAAVPPWAITVGTDHTGWVALLDRISELLAAAMTPDAAEQLCRNRIDVAAAKARVDGEGQWFASTSLFTRSSFEHWAHQDPKQFTRKPAKKREDGALIGAAAPRNDHDVGLYDFNGKAQR
jgi:hypothetical protein